MSPRWSRSARVNTSAGVTRDIRIVGRHWHPTRSVDSAIQTSKGVAVSNSDDARSVVESWYTALAAGDVDRVVAGFHPDVVASVVGSTPVSGRFFGRDA